MKLVAPDIVLTAAHCSESFHEAQVGRFNRSNETEQYDSLIVESIHTHPEYFRNRFLDPDPHDFAIVKLFGQATIPTKTTNQNPIITINRDNAVPSPNEIMHVAGWGAINASNWNEQSDVLRETDAFYIPTEKCKEFDGNYQGHTIDFEEVVVDGATLCAMNFDDLSDSCRGDSGGPLVVQHEMQDEGSSGQSGLKQSLLVGVVSAGYGCANPKFPALYARVSHVHDWIRDLVCELSVYPPDDFDCHGRGNLENNTGGEGAMLEKLSPPCDYTEPRVGASTNATSADVSRGDSKNDALTSCHENGQHASNIQWTNITLELQLDTRPRERGWILRYLEGDEKENNNDNNKNHNRVVYRTVAERPILSYADSEPWTVVTELVTVPNNREYQLVLLDSYGDGHDFYSLVDEHTTDYTPLIRVVDSEGVELLSAHQFHSQDNAFYTLFDLTVGTPATEAPTATMSPSESMSPSSAPTIERPYIFLVIRFGDVPQNIGFRLERLYGHDATTLAADPVTAEQKQSNAIESQNKVLQVVYPGTFPSELKNEDITVKVPIDHVSDSPQTYRFTMTSNEGGGLTSGGFYEVWLGEPYEQRLLCSGGDKNEFFHESYHVFIVDPLSDQFQTTSGGFVRSSSLLMMEMTTALLMLAASVSVSALC
jgi:hypothetical protein